MKMTKKETGDGIAFARKEAYEWEGTQYEADIQNGDRVTIKDSGIVEVHPQYGEQHKFVISTRNGDKRASFNQSSINVLIDSFGEESEQWIGKEVNVITEKRMIAGEKRIVAYFVTEGWTLDEWGELVNESQESKPEPKTGVSMRDAAHQPADDDSVPF